MREREFGSSARGRLVGWLANTSRDRVRRALHGCTTDGTWRTNWSAALRLIGPNW
jgi:hypothetical protein